MERTERIPTNEQVKALKQFARIEGRCWKSTLRQAWMNGDYGIHNDISGYLQQVRNQFGPSWLTKYELPNVTIKPVKGGFFVSHDLDPLTGKPWEPGERRGN